LTPQARAAGSPRNFPGVLFLIKGRKDGVLVKSMKGAAGLLTEPQYVLRKSIKARLGFRKTVLDNVSLISEAVAAGYEEGMKEVSSTI
jgi:hypothetical protein